MEKTLEEYNKIQAIRKWNAGFRTPPVPTTKWNEKDWEKWRESQKPLPPFEEWLRGVIWGGSGSLSEKER